MRPVMGAVLAIAVLVGAGCTSSGTPSHDPGRVVMPVKRVAGPGRLYLTKSRTLYRLAGTRLTALLRGTTVKDPAVSPDGSRLAFVELQAQSSSIVLSDVLGQNRRTITPAAAAEGALWAFAPAFSADGGHIAYLTDRGKQRSSPQNLQPNDLGIWMEDTAGGQPRSLVAPVAYTGGDSDPTFRPGVGDQLLYTSYLYGGVPLQPEARLSWLSVRTGARAYLSPDQARNFEPAISPDGRFVAFIHGSPAGDDLEVDHRTTLRFEGAGTNQDLEGGFLADVAHPLGRDNRHASAILRGSPGCSRAASLRSLGADTERISWNQGFAGAASLRAGGR